MADDEVGLDAALVQGGEHRERRRNERRLLHRGVVELLGVGVEAQTLEVEPARLAPAPKTSIAAGIASANVPAHPGLERALAREAEGDLVHAAFSPVQRINALPHVRPAPIPVINTSFPA